MTIFLTRLLFLVFSLFIIFGCTKDAMIAPEENWEYDPVFIQLETPLFFPVIDIPADNPMTQKGVQLGRMLYYDPILHPQGTQACASCHMQENSFTSGPAVLPHINLGWNSAFLWDGKIQGSLEDIMLFEVEEFFKTDLEKLKRDTAYSRLFFEAFGEAEITSKQTAKALAQFLRTMISGNSKYDQVMRQEPGVYLTNDELNGYDLFFSERGDCFHCHGGILFTDNEFHNNALDQDPDPGLGDITGSTHDYGKFKTPTLRNIELTGPYMHDGRYETLEEVIDFYSEGLKNSSTVDPLMKGLPHGGKNLTDDEKEDLLAFLKTLTDTIYTNNPSLSNPF